MAKISSETRLVGLPVSGGVALARVCLVNERRHSTIPFYKVEKDGARREMARLERAVRLACERLDLLIDDVARRVGRAEAHIFRAQRMVLEDKALLADMIGYIEGGRVNAEAAVARALDLYESRLLEVDDEYIKERASDLGEVRRRLLDVLGNMNPSLQCAGEPYCQRGRNRIIVAGELTPSLTMELDVESVRGFVTEHGGPTSHAAILSRALGVPAVSGIRGVHDMLGCGTEILVNGDTGEVIVWPSESMLARYAQATREAVPREEAVEPVEGLTVMANVSSASDVADAAMMKAEGIGLYRTEFEFLAAGRLLSEDEMARQYAAVTEAMNGWPIYFRLLDVGGDKSAAFFNLPREDNPYLGLRGSRLLLARRDLLAAQARALARVSAYGPVHVMYPMVVDPAQFRLLKRLFNEAIADLVAGEIRHGVMFEVPSACLDARELLEEADFASIGTNDLIQYLFAVDRNNELVAYDYSPDRPALWSLVARIAEAARRTGRPLSVCGEVAAAPRFVVRLRRLGINTISVSPRLIPRMRLAFSSFPSGRR